MRRIGRGSKNDVIVDLTSLLDVMFIILLVVLCGQSTITEDLSETQSRAEYAISQAKEEKWLYEEQQEIVNNVWAVSIMVPYDENEVIQKHIASDEIAEDGYVVKVMANPEKPELKMALITAKQPAALFYGAVESI